MSDPPTFHCIGCGYPLEGLAVPRCPECGRAFDPDDPMTYEAAQVWCASKRSSARWFQVTIALAALGVAAASIGAVLAEALTLSSPVISVGLLFFVAAAVTCGLSFVRGRDAWSRQRQRCPWLRLSGPAIAAFLVVAIAIMVTATLGRGGLVPFALLPCRLDREPERSRWG